MATQSPPKKKNLSRLSSAVIFILGTIFIYVLCPAIAWDLFVATIPQFPNSHITDHYNFIPGISFDMRTLEGELINASGGSMSWSSSTDSPNLINQWYRKLDWFDPCSNCITIDKVTNLDLGFLKFHFQRSAYVVPLKNKEETRILTQGNYYMFVVNGWITTLLLSLPEFVLCYIIFIKT